MCVTNNLKCCVYPEHNNVYHNITYNPDACTIKFVEYPHQLSKADRVEILSPSLLKTFSIFVIRCFSFC